MDGTKDGKVVKNFSAPLAELEDIGPLESPSDKKSTVESPL